MTDVKDVITNMVSYVESYVNNEKYVFFIPRGGFSNCLRIINEVMDFCKLTNRTLLLDMTSNEYGINCDEHFYLKYDTKIISDTNTIKRIVSNKNLSVSPNNLEFSLEDIFYTKRIPGITKKKGETFYRYKDNPIQLSNKDKSDIIFYYNHRGGYGWSIFKERYFLRNQVKEICKKRVSVLGDNYLCIQVRCTDIKSSIKKLYYTNKKCIQDYNVVYICTDNEDVVKFFKARHENVYCFTTFPEHKEVNLHGSSVPGDVKFQDMMTDILVATKSNKIISNSRGGFTNLLMECHNNSNIVMNKFS